MTKYTTLMMSSQLSYNFSLLCRVCRQFSMNGYRLTVWVGRDGIMFVSCFSVSIVVSGFSYAAQSLRCLLWGWCVFGSLSRFASLCESMLTLSCCWRCLLVCISGGPSLGTLLCLLQVYSISVNIHCMFSCPVFLCGEAL